MRALMLVPLLLLICSHSAYGFEYTGEERAFRDEALASLRPYGPGYYEEQRGVWQKLIGLAASHEDEEIVKAMFAAGEKSDGAMAMQYSLDMLELYRKNPAFFARAVKKFYKGGIDSFLPLWINEAGDVAAGEIVSLAGEPVTDPVLREFVEKAVALEEIVFDAQ